MESYLFHIIEKKSNKAHMGLIRNFVILSQNNSFVIYDQKFRSMNLAENFGGY